MGIEERKEREKAMKREHFLDAAQKVFIARGFETATMDEIAEKAEYSKGTLYLYFKDKEELYIAVAGRQADLFYTILKKNIDKADTGAKKLEAIKDSYLEFYVEHREEGKILINMNRYANLIDRVMKDEKTSREVMEKSNNTQQLIMAAIQQAIAEGALPEWADKTEEEQMLLYLGGAMLLEGVMKAIFDVEPVLDQFYPVKPEKVIQAAFSLLKF